jgi:mRNA interferase RelE/StbE
VGGFEKATQAVSYKITVASAAKKFLKRLDDASLGSSLAKAIDGLSQNPRPPGSAKLEGREDRHRIRVGDYRVIYQIRDSELVVLVVKIGHRREIYR